MTNLQELYEEVLNESNVDFENLLKNDKKEEIIKELSGRDCGNHGCYFAKNKTGQRTNGGCSCLSGVPLKTKIKLMKMWRAHNE